MNKPVADGFQGINTRLTTNQLITSAHVAAKYLPVASSQLMSEMAVRLDSSIAATRQACDERRAALNTIAKIRELTCCPDEIDVQDWIRNMVCGDYRHG
ncbi:hypothetical protein GFB19_02935 [Escherichia coli]|uniref:hypothetical protein n=1 Tax=Escherichia coli TaxID=562 RepID=UPI0017D7D734|nr:hypothetical protein [Escherichia coli]EFE6859263.1 hypothetical protein [Escherichia coli]EGB2408931.1 hypothetical protein [Escherichia coli]MCB4483539.1 hypothetical protein [Escherichia coli]CAK0702984.1 hypothetical protein FGAF467_15020 [Escherichia coli]HDD9043193.1 hypothetical protein [Escherichia coli]